MIEVKLPRIAFQGFLLLGARAVLAQEFVTHMQELGLLSPRRSYDVRWRQDLDERPTLSSSEILNTVPGLQFISSSGAGVPKSLSLRGSLPENLLVLWDDVPLNDPLNPSGAFDFSQIDFSEVDRFEILRGAEALSLGYSPGLGILRLYSKKATGDRWVPSVKMKVGSHRENAQILGLSRANSRWSFFSSMRRSHTAALSSASEKAGNSEVDRELSREFLNRLDYQISSRQKVGISLRYFKNNFQSDSFGGRGGDDPNEGGSQRSLSWHGFHHWNFAPLWTQHLEASYLHVRRHDLDEEDGGDFSQRDSHYQSSRFLILDRVNAALSANHRLQALLAFEEERAEFLESRTQNKKTRLVRTRTGLSHEYHPGNFLSVQSVRVEDDVQQRHRLGALAWSPSYRWDSTETLLRGQVGKYTRSPSLYQRESRYGNTQLRPEKIRSFDAGVEQKIYGGEHQISASYFENHFTELVDFNLVSSQYQNISRVKTWGWESELLLFSRQKLSGVLAYTWLKTKDLSSSEPLLRRARHHLLPSMTYRFLPDWTAQVEGEYLGRRDDINPQNFQRFSAESFWLFHGQIAWRWRWGRQVGKAKLSVRNILGKSYERAAGFNEPGRSFLAEVETCF